MREVLHEPGKGLWVVPVFLAACLGGCATPSVFPATTGPPQWIWCAPEAEPGQSARFQRTLELPDELVIARLWAAGDDRMEISVNGTVVGESSTWDRPVEVDVRPDLVRGRNTIEVWVENDSGPAGLCLELEVSTQMGAHYRLVSDGTWLAVGTSASPTRVFVLAQLGDDPWGALGPGERPEASTAIAGGEVQAPTGFRVERLYSVPKVRQGSWVCLTDDGEGRLIASDQYGGLFRITPPPIGANEAVQVEELDVDLGEAQGLLVAFGALYVVVNGSGQYTSGLYRLRDLDGDDRYETLDELATFAGNGEHGPHAILESPDGRSLYVIAGNHTELPPFTHSRVPELWGEDRLGPRFTDPNGHAVNRLAPGGWIARTDPDGKSWELIAVGLRNAYDMAFDPAGELFAWDADMEWDEGLPWYRPTRVLHVTSGAEFGWRTGTGKWPAHVPDGLPPCVEIGRTSPTGVLFGTETDFPAPWNAALFVADWAFGTLHVAHLEQEGASYAGRSEPFLEGRGLPLTDLATTGDGALYFTTGGRRVQSGLYRVVWTGPRDVAGRAAPVAREAAVARDLRRELEAFHAQPNPSALDDIWPHLDAPDRHVRFAARTAIELLPPDAWSARAWAEARPRAAREAALALVRADDTCSAERLLEHILAQPLEALAEDDLLATLRVIELALVRLAPPPDAVLDALRVRLSALLPAGDDRVERELVRLLAYLRAPGIVEVALEILDGAPTQETAIDVALALSQVETGWDTSSSERYVSWLAEACTSIEGGHSVRKYLERIREHAHATLGIPLPTEEALAAAEAVAPAPTPKNDWTLAQLLPALARLDEPERSLARGREVYERATCASCHRYGDEGGSQGPDLTGVAGRFTSRDLLDALLDPSAVVSDQYRDVEVWTHAGDVVVGRIESVENGELTLRTGLDDRRVTVLEEDVEETRPHPLSRMPEDLLDPFDEADVLDLMAYLLSDRP